MAENRGASKDETIEDEAEKYDYYECKLSYLF